MRCATGADSKTRIFPSGSHRNRPKWSWEKATIPLFVKTVIEQSYGKLHGTGRSVLGEMEPRIRALALLVKPYLRIADIGAGSGQLASVLMRAGHHVIVTDSSRISIESLRRTMPLGTDVRLGNGFDAIEPSEVDAAVVAGLGGRTIARILQRGFLRSQSWVLILQPMQDLAAVVQALRSGNRGVIQAKLVLSRDRLYPILMASADQAWNGPDEVQWDSLGWWLRSDPLWPLWISKHLEQCTHRRDKVNEKSVQGRRKIAAINEEIAWLGGLVDVGTQLARPLRS